MERRTLNGYKIGFWILLMGMLVIISTFNILYGDLKQSKEFYERSDKYCTQAVRIAYENLCELGKEYACPSIMVSSKKTGNQTRDCIQLPSGRILRVLGQPICWEIEPR